MMVLKTSKMVQMQVRTCVTDLAKYKVILYCKKSPQGSHYMVTSAISPQASKTKSPPSPVLDKLFTYRNIQSVS